MHSRLLVSGLPRSLPSLPRSPAPPCLPCVEGRQRAAPHSSEFPPTTAPPQTLHMDVWGPAPVGGTDQERYFLLVVDDYARYTTVFPLRCKADVSGVLIPWIRATRCQLRERFCRDFPVLRLHFDRGGEFSSDLLVEFCRDEGIRHTLTLPASPQQNGIAESRFGLIMEVARTSKIHAAAPHFPWPFVWTRKVGDASVFRVWGALSLVRDAKESKLSSRTLRCVFLGFPTNAPPWQFYHPRECRVFSSQDGLAPSGVSQVDPPPLVEPLEISSDSSGPAEGGDPAADDTVATRCSPRLETPPGFPPRPSSPPPQPAVVVSGAKTAGGELGGVETEGEGSGGAASGGVGTGGANSGVAESPSGGGAVGDPAGGPGAGQPPQPDLLETLSPQAIRAWIVRRGSPGGGGYGPAGAGAASPGGTTGVGGTGGTAGGAAGAGGTRGAAGAGGAGATSPRGATGAGGVGPTSPGGTAGAGGAGGAAGAGGAGGGGTGGAGAGGPGGARTGGAGAAGAGGAVSAGGAGGIGAAGTGGAGATGAGATGAACPGGARTRGTGAAGAGGAASAGGATGAGGAASAGGATGATGIGGAGAAGAGGAGAGGTGGAGAAGPGGARTRGAGAARAGGATGARGAGGATGAASTGGAGGAPWDRDDRGGGGGRMGGGGSNGGGVVSDQTRGRLSGSGGREKGVRVKVSNEGGMKEGVAPQRRGAGGVDKKTPDCFVDLSDTTLSHTVLLWGLREGVSMKNATRLTIGGDLVVKELTTTIRVKAVNKAPKMDVCPLEPGDDRSRGVCLRTKERDGRVPTVIINEHEKVAMTLASGRGIRSMD
ncbi:unnamed protein product [Closterium sp. NIES-53]